MSSERGIRTLAWCCGGLAGAVFLSVLLLPLSALPVLALLSLIAGLLCLRGWRNPSRCAALFLLCAALGFLFFSARASRVTRQVAALDGEVCTIRARVLEYPKVYENSTTLRVRVTSEELPHGKCQLSCYGGEPLELTPGDEIVCEVKFTSAFFRRGEESDTLTSAGVFLRGAVRGQVTKTGTWRYAALYAPQRWRQAVKTGTQRVFPADTAAFQQALLTGDKSGLYDELPLYYSLSRAGLMHAAAVSGMHVAFLVGFLELLLPNRRRLGFLLLPLLGAFAALSGFTPSVCRAVFIQSMTLIAPLFRRESDPPTSLLLVLAILLLINPYAAASVSLQLSFAATAGILLFSRPIFEKTAGRLPQNRLGVAAAASLSASLSALLLTLPLTAWHFGVITLAAPVSNVLCMGLLPVLFVGGYGAVLLGFLFPSAGKALGACLGWGDRLLFAVAKATGSLPCAALYTSNRLYVWWLVLTCLLLASAVLWGRRREEGVRLAAPLCLSAICLFSCVLYVRADRKGLRVTAIDMGQGSCTLIECGDNAVMVDCGGSTAEGYVGERAAYYALGRERPRLSALVLTHLHGDHVNGVERLLALVDVDTIYLPDLEPGSFLEILDTAEKRRTRVVRVTEELLLTGEELTLRLTPPLDLEEDEESGLFVLASRDGWDVLITGDASRSQERRYVQLAAPPDIELLIVGHHGSANATADYLLDELRPETAVISVGHNTYGHPSDAALERLESRGIAVHRTDTEGTITVKGEP